MKKVQQYIWMFPEIRIPPKHPKLVYFSIGTHCFLGNPHFRNHPWYLFGGVPSNIQESLWQASSVDRCKFTGFPFTSVPVMSLTRPGTAKQAIWRICLPIWISVPARMENHTGFIGKTWRSRIIFNNMMELRRGWWKIIVTNSKSSPSPWGNHRLGPQVMNRSDIKPRFWLHVFHLWKKALKGFKRYIQCWFEGQSTQETSATTRTGRTGCVQCVCVCLDRWMEGWMDLVQ